MLFVEQIEAQVQQLDAGGSGYGDWIKKKGELNEKQKTATSQLLALIPPHSSSDPAKANDVKTTLAQLEIANRQIAPYLDEYNEKLKAIRQREKMGISILGAAENAVAEWGVAYQQLAQAVKVIILKSRSPILWRRQSLASTRSTSAKAIPRWCTRRMTVG